MIQILKYGYRQFRARGMAGVYKKVRSRALWTDALPRLFHVRDRRSVLSKKYITGSGVEIGALFKPLPVAAGVRVRYVDRLDESGLRKAYPDLGAAEAVSVDIIDDGETLASIDDQSLDFVIANHFLEHCQNPLGTIRNHLAKLRPGGTLFYVLPNKRRTFDHRRPVTPFDHLIKDDRDGPQLSRGDHYREWLRLVEGCTDADAIEATVRDYEQRNFNIHFHVWDRPALGAFFKDAQSYLGDGFEIRESRPNGAEIIVVLQANCRLSATRSG